jgi:hypothetical protein
MATAWPVVAARLATIASGLGIADLKVFEGPVKTGNTPARYLCIGWQPSVDNPDAGTLRQERTGPDGYLCTETGTVNCELAAGTGNPTVPSAFDVYDALCAAVYADQTLGVMPQGSTAALSVTVLEAQNRPGAVQRLLVIFTYSTSIT